MQGRKKHEIQQKKDDQIQQNAVLAGLRTTQDPDRFQRDMEELRSLAAACGIGTAAVITQTADMPVPATFVGGGKIEEIKGTLYLLDVRLVIFGDTLSPTQIRNLSRALDAEVIDRTDLILRIFEQRARTREAKLQVEYARLEYTLPRLVGLRENLSRQGGASGAMSVRGAGETKLELDRRRIQSRMAKLRRMLAEIGGERGVLREKRLSSPLPRVGLVGYTNAGKSTLMNRLLDLSTDAGGEKSGEDRHDRHVFAEDMLFATLDTTVRRIALPGTRPFLLIDTVGFVGNLPHALVEAFHSTLEEVLFADVLLMVVDVSDPDYRMQIETTERTLAEIGAGAIPVIRVMNKTDLAEGRTLPARRGEGEVFISAAHGDGVQSMVQEIFREIGRGEKTETFLFPYSEGASLHLLNMHGTVLETDYREDGIFVRAACSERLGRMLKGYAV